VEMLDLVLPKKVAKDLNTLFDFLLDPLLSRKIYVQPEINSFFNKIVYSEDAAFSPWTKAVCIYTAWKNKQRSFINGLKIETGRKEHYIVKETKHFVINALESEVHADH
jgi:ATP:ADP antiporter, AAA family